MEAESDCYVVGPGEVTRQPRPEGRRRDRREAGRGVLAVPDAGLSGQRGGQGGHAMSTPFMQVRHGLWGVDVHVHPPRPCPLLRGRKIGSRPNSRLILILTISA